MKKVFKFRLNSTEIEKTINSLKHTKSELNSELKEDIKKILNFGEDYCKKEITYLNAIDSGELLASIKHEISENKLEGKIFTDCKHAKFVEYGTGIIGKNKPTDDIPNDWIYDKSNHGEKGWTYFNEKIKKFFTTKGMVGRPFFLNTFLEIERKINEII